MARIVAVKTKPDRRKKEDFETNLSPKFLFLETNQRRLEKRVQNIQAQDIIQICALEAEEMDGEKKERTRTTKKGPRIQRLIPVIANLFINLDESLIIKLFIKPKEVFLDTKNQY